MEKFDRLSVTIDDAKIITSRDAKLSALTQNHGGILADPNDGLSDINFHYIRLRQNAGDYEAVDGFLFLSSANWSAQEQRLLETSVITNARPVLMANADLVIPQETGFSLEPGFNGIFC